MLDCAPEGTDEIEDVLGDGQVAIVELGIEELAAALEEFKLGECEMDRNGRHLKQGVQRDQDGELRSVSELGCGGEFLGHAGHVIVFSVPAVRAPRQPAFLPARFH